MTKDLWRTTIQDNACRANVRTRHQMAKRLASLCPDHGTIDRYKDTLKTAKVKVATYMEGEFYGVAKGGLPQMIWYEQRGSNEDRIFVIFTTDDSAPGQMVLEIFNKGITKRAAA